MAKHLEDTLAISVSYYIKTQYPKVLFSHIPNGGKRNIIEAVKFKKMGVRKGIPDFLIFETNNPHIRGIAIELKVKPNKPTPEQLDVIEQMKKLKWNAYVCYSFDEAKKVIDYNLG